MTLRDTISLIPRNNWDYGLDALVGATAGVLRHVSESPNLATFFEQDPVWTNAGRTSLYAILKALELPSGAEVGVPLFCCSVVFDAICQAGLKPRFIDSNIDDYNLSVEDLGDKLSGLAAVVPVHMFGNPADMDSINAVAGGIPVIEDCAQSFMSKYKGRQTGLLSTVSFFSFRCGKYVSAGEGSAIVCKDPDLREAVAKVTESFDPWSGPGMFANVLSTFAKATLYNRPWYGLVGHPIGMRLDRKLNLTAKDGFDPRQIAASQLAVIDERVDHFQDKIDVQRRHARALLDSLIPGRFELPCESADTERNWFQFPIRFKDSADRDRMADYLLRRGIDTAKYLSDIAEVAAVRFGYSEDCPNAELLARTVLLVPIHYTLRPADIDHIARTINEGAGVP